MAILRRLQITVYGFYFCFDLVSGERFPCCQRRMEFATF